MNVQLTDKKEVIFESALELLQDNGFHGTPMSQIATKANISVGSIYHYFESKEALIIELYSYCKCKLMLDLFDGLTKDNQNYEQHFKIVWKRFVQFYLTHPHYFRFLNQFYSSPFHEMERLKKEELKTVETTGIQRFLEAGREANILRNTSTPILCAAFTGVAVSFVKAILFGKVDMQAQQTEEMVDIVWKSIKA